MSGAAKGKGAKNASVIRVLMIGDSAVGKTSLVIRFDEDSFSTKFITTIGVDYRDKLVTIEGAPIKLQIWDTAGQERFRSLTANFFGKADGFVVCFDVASRPSFEHVASWVADIHKNARGDVDVVLCGCKCDLPEASRQVTAAEAEALATKSAARGARRALSSRRRADEADPPSLPPRTSPRRASPQVRDAVLRGVGEAERQRERDVPRPRDDDQAPQARVGRRGRGRRARRRRPQGPRRGRQAEVLLARARTPGACSDSRRARARARTTGARPRLSEHL